MLKLKQNTLILFITLVSVCMLSCEGEDNSKAYLVDDAPDLSGEWELKGEGRQEGCDEALDNFSYDFALAKPLVLIASLSSGSSDPLVWGLALDPQTNLPGLDAFIGQAGAGSKLSFSFVDNAGSDPVYYQFSGDIYSNKTISGTLEATGPGNCHTPKGSFTLTLI